MTTTDPKTNSVGYLLEYCQKFKLIPPTYEELNSSGPSHATEFRYSCKFYGFETVGQSRQKNQAKFEAAKAMVQLLEDRNYDLTGKVPIKDVSPSRSGEKSPISALQEYCQSKRIALPIYFEGSTSEGLICECYVQKEMTFAKAASKKAAKRESARRMYNKLDVIEASLEEHTSEKYFNGKNSISALKELCASYTELPQPKYTIECEDGMFIVFCQVGEVSEKGIYPTERGAKMFAARKVIRELISAGYDGKKSTGVKDDAGDKSADCSVSDGKSSKKWFEAWEELNLNLSGAVLDAVGYPYDMFFRNADRMAKEDRKKFEQTQSLKVEHPSKSVIPNVSDANCSKSQPQTWKDLNFSRYDISSKLPENIHCTKDNKTAKYTKSVDFKVSDYLLVEEPAGVSIHLINKDLAAAKNEGRLKVTIGSVERGPGYTSTPSSITYNINVHVNLQTPVRAGKSEVLPMKCGTSETKDGENITPQAKKKRKKKKNFKKMSSQENQNQKTESPMEMINKVKELNDRALSYTRALLRESQKNCHPIQVDLTGYNKPF